MVLFGGLFPSLTISCRGAGFGARCTDFGLLVSLRVCFETCLVLVPRSLDLPELDRFDLANAGPEAMMKTTMRIANDKILMFLFRSVNIIHFLSLAVPCRF
jgi:hypothetical protein